MAKAKQRASTGPTESALKILVLLGAVTMQTAGAQEGADDLTLDEIVVTADRKDSFSADYVQAGTFRDARILDTALTANIMTRELLDSQQALSIADATRNSPGVTSHQINSTIYSNLAIRGIPTGGTTNFRLNGVLPIVNRIDMPLENKVRVEVLKGAAGLYYGFASPSGIVNLVTERPDDDLLELSASGDSHGGFGGSVDASKAGDTHGIRVNAAASRIETGIDETSGERYFASVAYDWAPNEKFVLNFDGEYVGKEITEPTLIILPAPVDGVITLPPLQDASTNFGSEWLKADAYSYNFLVRAQYDFSPAWSAKFSVGHVYLDTLRRFSSFSGFDYATGDGTVAVFTFPKNTFDRVFVRGDVAGVFRTGRLEHEVIFGISRDSMDIQTPAAVAQGSITQNLYNPTARLPEMPEPPLVVSNLSETQEGGVYFTDRVTVTDWLELTVGVRFTDYSNESFTTDIDISPTTNSLSVLLKPRGWMSIYGSYIEGLEEGGIAPGISNNPGEVLPAAVSEQWETGIKMEPRRGLLLTAAYFDIERETSFLNADNFFVQDGRASYRGIELSASGELSDALSIAASATYLDSEQKSGPASLIGNRIENTPEFTGSLFLEYAIPQIDGLRVNGGVYHIGERAVNAANNAFVDGYTLFDLGVSYEADIGGRPVLFRLNGHNVTGEEHWEATGSGLVQQGPPGYARFYVSTSF